MKKIEKNEEFYDFIAQNKPVIVVFSTHDCSTCVPVEKKIDENFQDIEKAKVYLDDMAQIRGSLGIFNVPVVCIYFDSKEFARFIRVFSISQIKEKLDRLKEFM